MINILKLLGARGTDLRNNSFFLARIRLTLLYTLVFGTLVLCLSGVFYYLFAQDIHEDMSSVFAEGSEQVYIINYHKGRLLSLMVLADTAVLIFIAASSYLLAGVTLKPVEQNYEAQKRFIADASHELRTPIAVLKADMEIYLQDKKLSAFLRPIFKSYLEEVNHMGSIVENLLTLFRFDSNQVKLCDQRFSLDNLIEANTTIMRSYAKLNHVSLKLHTVKGIYIIGDPQLFRQAFRNVLKNSIEYSDKDGVVNISLKKKSRQAVIEVNNFGVRVPEKDITHVFDRFYRTQESIIKRREGSGLGLPVSKRIVDKHGGTIGLKSTSKTGTTVRITLPLSKA